MCEGRGEQLQIAMTTGTAGADGTRIPFAFYLVFSKAFRCLNLYLIIPVSILIIGWHFWFSFFFFFFFFFNEHSVSHRGMVRKKEAGGATGLGGGEGGQPEKRQID